MLTEAPDLDAARSVVAMIDGNLGSFPTQGAGIVFAVKDVWTYIATADHVVRDGNTHATGLKVRLWQNQSETSDAEIYKIKEEFKLAVIRAKIPKTAFLFSRLADANQLKKSQVVYAIGHPNGEGPWNATYSPGPISDDIGPLYFKVQSPYIKPGHSGGPLIDERRMIAGIVLDTDGTTADALRIDRAIEILRREFGLSVELSLGEISHQPPQPPNPNGATLETPDATQQVLVNPTQTPDGTCRFIATWRPGFTSTDINYNIDGKYVGTTRVRTGDTSLKFIDFKCSPGTHRYSAEFLRISEGEVVDKSQTCNGLLKVNTARVFTIGPIEATYNLKCQVYEYPSR
jgi:hypothetical protein